MKKNRKTKRKRSTASFSTRKENEKALKLRRKVAGKFLMKNKEEGGV